MKSNWKIHEKKHSKEKSNSSVHIVYQTARRISKNCVVINLTKLLRTIMDRFGSSNVKNSR